MFYTIEGYKQLSHQQMQQLQLLVNICYRHDGYQLRLPWQRLNYQPDSICLSWLVMQRGQIIAYLGIADCQPVVLVHPKYRQRGIASLLLRILSAYPSEAWHFIVPTGAKFAIAWLQKNNLVQQYTYHEMVCQQAPAKASLPAFNLRQANETDVETLVHIHASGFNREPSQMLNFYQTQLEQPHNACWLGINANGQAVAMAQTRQMAQGYLINNLAVLPSHQGQGYGRALVTHLLRYLAPKQKQSAWLEVLAGNDAALRLYKKCGFKISRNYNHYRYTPPAL